MKRKHFFVVLFLIMAIFLSGCGIITDEEKIRDVIDEYFLAINDQDWDKAKSCCIYESNVYHETCFLEDKINDLSQSSSFVIIICLVDILDITIIRNYASAYIDVSITLITDDFSVTNDSPGYFYLQKIYNEWKIFDQKYIVR